MTRNGVSVLTETAKAATRRAMMAVPSLILFVSSEMETPYASAVVVMPIVLSPQANVLKTLAGSAIRKTTPDVPVRLHFVWLRESRTPVWPVATMAIVAKRAWDNA